MGCRPSAGSWTAHVPEDRVCRFSTQAAPQPPAWGTNQALPFLGAGSTGFFQDTRCPNFSPHNSKNWRRMGHRKCCPSPTSTSLTFPMKGWPCSQTTLKRSKRCQELHSDTSICRLPPYRNALGWGLQMETDPRRGEQPAPQLRSQSALSLEARFSALGVRREGVFFLPWSRFGSEHRLWQEPPPVSAEHRGKHTHLLGRGR